ncbi:Ubiquitin carboxyl-terminal hydrolase 4, partial [Frankliniella fusca]
MRRAGFANAGQSCYVGAALQLLLHVEPLVEMLAKNVDAGPITSALALLSLQHRSQRVVDPTPLILEMNNLDIPNIEGDLHIFLDYLLTCLMEEINNEGIENLFWGGIEKYGSSIQEGLSDYGNVQVHDDICCGVNLLITETVCYAPKYLILRADKGEGFISSEPFELSNNIMFGNGTYKFLAAALKLDGQFYKVIVKYPDDIWLMYFDGTVKNVNPCSLQHMMRHELYMVLYQRANDPPWCAQDLCRVIDSQNFDVASMFVPSDEFAANNYVSPVKVSPGLIRPLQVSPAKLEKKIVVSPLIEQKIGRKKKWVPTVPEDLTTQLAAAEHISLELFDPLLTENDVPGAKLKNIDYDDVKVSELRRWLACRGDSQTGNKKELFDRVQLRIETKTDHIIDPSIDGYKWYGQKKDNLMKQYPDSRPVLLPLKGWDQFPSVNIPTLFNWGHAHVFLVETAPNWSAALDIPFDDGDEYFSQDVAAESVGQTDIARKGMRFLLSDHILEIMDTENKEFYFVKARVQASMRSEVYFPTVTMRKVSGSVRECTCSCMIRTMGRCSHVASLLLFITRHVDVNGYGAKSCTDRPCAWGQGAVLRDPGNIKDKAYGAEKHTTRSYFEPRASAFQGKTSDDWHNQRALHFTASQAKRLLSLTPAGYKGFLREKLWGIDKFKGNSATKYGEKSEEKAREQYKEEKKRIDPTVKVKKTGMWVNPTCMELSCSPDGLVLSKDSPTKLLEIKCPALLKSGHPNYFEKHLTKKQQKRFCLARTIKGKLKLKKDHVYWYQVQMSLGILQLEECDFIVWSPKGMHKETIKFHLETWLNLTQKLVALHNSLLVPEYFLMRTPRKLEPILLKYN